MTEKLGAPPTRQLKTCRYCKRSGFVWYLSKNSRWVLAEPKEDLSADPHKVHICPVRATEKALRRASNGIVGRYGTRSYKPSTYRRGRSPSSYG